MFRRALCVLTLAVAALVATEPAHAQGDGPRSQLLVPVDVNVLVPTYLYLSGNYNFAGNILVPGADVKSNVFVLTYTRAFAIGDRYAQVWVSGIGGRIKAAGTVTTGTGRQFSVGTDASGLGDSLINFKIGLLGAAPLGVADFARQNQDFQLSAFAQVSIPTGEYDSNKPLNLGTNVWALRLGVPMVAPFGSLPRATFLEIFPSVIFYTDNNDPTLGANEREQKPMFAFESHLSHNFTPRQWGSLDARYHYGGETTTDGIPDNNRQDVLGGGATLGYSLTPAISIQGTYGAVLTGSNDSKEDLLRLRLSFIV